MIKNISIHKVGNKLNDESLFLSKQQLALDELLENSLSNYFLTPFKSEEYYHFHHDLGLSLNAVYTCVSAVFENPNTLHEHSESLAKHLYNQSLHPKIKGGEFYVVYFPDCTYGGETIDAVGLFKSENRDAFLEVEQRSDGFDIERREGININKLDKGCLIFNKEKENGYVVSIIDNTNKGAEAKYWKDDFLSLAALHNDFHQTNQFLGIAKQFVTNKLSEDFEVSKADQIDFLNRSVDFFKKNETFDKQEFETEVLANSDVIESFKKFEKTYREENGVELSDNFAISEQAVKKQAKVFKNVLKLDKNFHIYIHGKRELIEQGVDDKGRKFYKIYYENEA